MGFQEKPTVEDSFFLDFTGFELFQFFINIIINHLSMHGNIDIYFI